MKYNRSSLGTVLKLETSSKNHENYMLTLNNTVRVYPNNQKLIGSTISKYEKLVYFGKKRS